MLPRLTLAHLPTPMHHFDAIDRLIGAEVWFKRDDFTAGAAAGNKIRKLEFLLGHAVRRAKTHLLTCGGEQSNHARATALLAAQFNMRSVLVLRTQHPTQTPPVTGNLLLAKLTGARVIWVNAQEYEQRDRVMSEEAARLSLDGAWPYVIPEGGSNGLGAMGYVEAMREVRQQLDLGLLGSIRSFDCVVVPCGSGGTAAGIALGAGHYSIAQRVVAVAVCASARYFREKIDQILVEARAINPSLAASVPVQIVDEFRGPSYAVASEEQMAFIAEVARVSGIILDPVYTGKALFGLARLKEKPSQILFVHTGGLPGALAQAHALSAFATLEA